MYQMGNNCQLAKHSVDFLFCSTFQGLWPSISVSKLHYSHVDPKKNCQKQEKQYVSNG